MGLSLLDRSLDKLVEFFASFGRMDLSLLSAFSMVNVVRIPSLKQTSDTKTFSSSYQSSHLPNSALPQSCSLRLFPSCSSNLSIDMNSFGNGRCNSLDLKCLVYSSATHEQSHFRGGYQNQSVEEFNCWSSSRNTFPFRSPSKFKIMSRNTTKKHASMDRMVAIFGSWMKNYYHTHNVDRECIRQYIKTLSKVYTLMNCKFNSKMRDATAVYVTRYLENTAVKHKKGSYPKATLWDLFLIASSVCLKMWDDEGIDAKLFLICTNWSSNDYVKFEREFLQALDYNLRI